MLSKFLYDVASKTCLGKIFSEESKSAIVLATLIILERALADSDSLSNAERNIFSQSGERVQCGS